MASVFILFTLVFLMVITLLNNDNRLILCAFGACKATHDSHKEHLRRFADKTGGRFEKRKTRACAPCQAAVAVNGLAATRQPDGRRQKKDTATPEQTAAQAISLQRPYFFFLKRNRGAPPLTAAMQNILHL